MFIKNSHFEMKAKHQNEHKFFTNRDRNPWFVAF